jgi:hypothetical protein
VPLWLAYVDSCETIRLLRECDYVGFPWRDTNTLKPQVCELTVSSRGPGKPQYHAQRETIRDGGE